MSALSFHLGAAIWLIAQSGNPTWEAQVQRGVELRLAGNEEQALATFREAAKTATSPRLLAQTALTEQSLGLWRDAEAHLVQALATADDPWITKNRSVLDGALVTVRSHLGSLDLRGGENGAEVFIDGRSEGTLPQARSLRLELGKHRLEVKHAGAFPFRRDVDITTETTSRETIVLAPLGSPPPAPAPLPAPGLEPPRTSTTTLLGWTFVAGAGAVSIFAIASLLTSNGHADTYNDNPACTGRPGQPESCSSDASGSRQWRTVSIASFAVGGALLATGTVFLLWKTPTSRVAVSTLEGGATLRFTGSF